MHLIYPGILLTVTSFSYEPQGESPESNLIALLTNRALFGDPMQKLRASLDGRNVIIPLRSENGANQPITEIQHWIHFSLYLNKPSN